MKTVLIKGGRVFTPAGAVRADVLIKDGKIAEVGNPKAAADEVIDADGACVAPGFIDIHTHGAGGADFMDGTVDAYLTAAKMYVRHGATLVYPTTCTSSNEDLFATLATYGEADARNTEGSRFGGLHLEGPYLSEKQPGAMDPRYLRCPSDPAEYMDIIRRGKGILKRWTFAPELAGAPEFAAALKANGILPSIGHTDATWSECDAAFRSGANHMTHFYSCMSTICRIRAHRVAGALEYGYWQKGMNIELIADGIHVPEELLKLVIAVKGVDRISVITDSMRAAGMPDGPSRVGSLTGGQDVIVDEGVAWVPDRHCFAGSVATADRLLRTMINIAGCTEEEAVRMATANPAKMMGVYDRKGSIEPGKDADIVIWKGNVEVERTIIGGETKYVK